MAVENWIGVLSSLNLVTLSSNTLPLSRCLLSTRCLGSFDELGNSNFCLEDRGLDGTVWVGESGNSLGDTIPLVKRLQKRAK